MVSSDCSRRILMSRSIWTQALHWRKRKISLGLKKWTYNSTTRNHVQIFNSHQFISIIHNWEFIVSCGHCANHFSNVMCMSVSVSVFFVQALILHCICAPLCSFTWIRKVFFNWIKPNLRSINFPLERFCLLRITQSNISFKLLSHLSIQSVTRMFSYR